MVDLRDLKASLEDLRLDSISSVGKRDHIVIEQTADALDQTQSAAQRDLAVSLLNRGAKTYRSVESALRRIEDGTYGVCLACDEPISAKRLQAVPWAEFCLTCQARLDAQARGLGGGADVEDHRSGSAQRD
jgi:DnaK suppressor protein